MMGARPYIWRPWKNPDTGRWHLVRRDEQLVIFDTSEVTYGSSKTATRDAAVWNEEEGHGKPADGE